MTVKPPEILYKTLIKNGDKYLIIKRSEICSYYPHNWGIPTISSSDDGLEPSYVEGERAIKERYGLDITIHRIINTYSVKLADGYNTDVVMYEATTGDSEVKLSPKHTEYRWVTINEMPSYSLLPSIQQFLTEISS